MELNYTLNPAERVAHLNSLDLSTLKPNQLEFLANYILHQDKFTPINSPNSPNSSPNRLQPTNHKPPSRLSSLKSSKTISSDSLHPNDLEHQKKEDTTRYIAPPKPINYSHPNLIPFRESIDQLKLKESNTSGAIQWKLKKWRTELQIDAGIAWNTTLCQINSHPPSIPPTPPTLDQVKMGESFHIKHIVENYTKLRQDGSADTQLLLNYFEEIVDTSPLKSWQFDILRLKCEGAKGILIGKYLWESHNKNFTPQSLSNALRIIYRVVADWATQLELEWADRNNPSQWRVCSKCGVKKHRGPYNFHKGRTECKECRVEGRKKKQNEEKEKEKQKQKLKETADE